MNHNPLGYSVSSVNAAAHGAAPAGEIGPAACSTALSATTCVASRRVAAAYGVAHLALRTPFYVQNHDALRAWEHWSTGVVLFRSREKAFEETLCGQEQAINIWPAGVTGPAARPFQPLARPWSTQATRADYFSV